MLWSGPKHKQQAPKAPHHTTTQTLKHRNWGEGQTGALVTHMVPTAGSCCDRLPQFWRICPICDVKRHSSHCRKSQKVAKFCQTPFSRPSPCPTKGCLCLSAKQVTLARLFPFFLAPPRPSFTIL
jgi:hypothetical protein